MPVSDGVENDAVAIRLPSEVGASQGKRFAEISAADGLTADQQRRDAPGSGRGLQTNRAGQRVRRHAAAGKSAQEQICRFLAGEGRVGAEAGVPLFAGTVYADQIWLSGCEHGGGIFSFSAGTGVVQHFDGQAAAGEQQAVCCADGAVNARAEDDVLAAPAGVQLRIRLVCLTARAVRADIAVRVADAPVSAERAALRDGTRPGGYCLAFERFWRVIRGHLCR